MQASVFKFHSTWAMSRKCGSSRSQLSWTRPDQVYKCGTCAKVLSPTVALPTPLCDYKLLIRTETNMHTVGHLILEFDTIWVRCEPPPARQANFTCSID